MNEELGLFLQGGHIHFSILGEGGGHGRDDSKQFFHQITSFSLVIRSELLNERSAFFMFKRILAHLIPLVNMVIVIFITFIQFFDLAIDIFHKAR